MAPRPPFNPLKSAKTFLLGKGLDLNNKEAFHNLSLIAFFAWVGLGADGLSSASYGPEEAFRALGSHHHLGLLVALGSAITVLVISASYSHPASCSVPSGAWSPAAPSSSTMS
jgi:hypothetical protein